MLLSILFLQLFCHVFVQAPVSTPTASGKPEDFVAKNDANVAKINELVGNRQYVSSNIMALEKELSEKYNALFPGARSDLPPTFYEDVEKIAKHLEEANKKLQDVMKIEFVQRHDDNKIPWGTLRDKIVHVQKGYDYFLKKIQFYVEMRVKYKKSNSLRSDLEDIYYESEMDETYQNPRYMDSATETKLWKKLFKGRTLADGCSVLGALLVNEGLKAQQEHGRLKSDQKKMLSDLVDRLKESQKRMMELIYDLDYIANYEAELGRNHDSHKNKFTDYASSQVTKGRFGIPEGLYDSEGWKMCRNDNANITLHHIKFNENKEQPIKSTFSIAKDKLKHAKVPDFIFERIVHVKDSKEMELDEVISAVKNILVFCDELRVVASYTDSYDGEFKIEPKNDSLVLLLKNLRKLWALKATMSVAVQDNERGISYEITGKAIIS